MNPLSGKTVPAKPIAGLAVILFIATVIGGWLFVDNTRAELEARIEALEARQVVLLPAEPPSPEPNGGRMMEPTAANGWHTETSAVSGRRFQIALPASHALQVNSAPETDQSVFVILKPTPENEAPTPDMIIELVDLRDPRYDGVNLGTRLVPVGDSRNAFLMTAWEDQYWEAFDLVAASFKAL